MSEQILSLVSAVIPFGPAVHVLARWQASPEKITPDMVKVVLLWTTFMMLIRVVHLNDLSDDLKSVCGRFQSHLVRETDDDSAAYRGGRGRMSPGGI